MCCILYAGCTSKKNIPDESMTISIDNKKITSNDSVKINNILFLINECNKQEPNDRSTNGAIIVQIKKDGKLYSMELYDDSIIYNSSEYTGTQIKSISAMITSTFFSNKLLSSLISSSTAVKVFAQANYNASHTFTDEEKKQFAKILMNSHNNTYNNTYMTPNMIKFPYYKLVLESNNKIDQIDILNETYIELNYDNYDQQFNVSSEVWDFLNKFNLSQVKDTSDIRYLYYSDKIKYINDENYKNVNLIDRKDLIITILSGGKKIEANKNMSKDNPTLLDFYIKNEIKRVTIYKNYFIYNNECYELQDVDDRIMSVLKAS